MQMELLKGETILDFGYFDRLSTSFGFWICLALSAGVRLFSQTPWLSILLRFWILNWNLVWGKGEPARSWGFPP